MTTNSIIISFIISCVSGLIISTLFFYIENLANRGKNLSQFTVNNYTIHVQNNHNKYFTTTTRTNSNNSSDSDPVATISLWIIIYFGIISIFAIYRDTIILIGWVVSIGVFTSILTLTILYWVKERNIEPISIWNLLGWLTFFVLLYIFTYPPVEGGYLQHLNEIKNGTSKVGVGKYDNIAFYQFAGFLFLAFLGISLTGQSLAVFVWRIIIWTQWVKIKKVTMIMLSKNFTIFIFFLAVISYLFVSGKLASWLHILNTRPLETFLSTNKMN